MKLTHLDISSMLSMLFGRKVDGRRGSTHKSEPEIAFGRFVDEDGATAGIIAFDVSLAAASAAALALRPAPNIRALATPLPASIAEDFFEVLNVLGGLANAHSACHLRLDSVEYGAPDAHWEASWRRRGYDLEIQGYGKGRVTVALRQAA